MADENKSFPRIPENNWWTLRDQFTKSPPKVVTPSYLKSLLGLTSEKAARNLLSPLRIVGLIDDDNKPTALANDWRTDSKYPEVCATIIEKIYPQELRDLFSGPDIDKQRLTEWISHTTNVGQPTAAQAASLYLLLLDGTPKSSTEFAKSSSKAAKQPRQAPKKPVTIQASQPASEIQIEKPLTPDANGNGLPQAHRLDNWFSLHVDLQIHISPEASAEQIDQIFASMAKHIVSMRRENNNEPES